MSDRDVASKPSSTMSVFGVEMPSWMVIAVIILAVLGAIFGVALTFGSDDVTVTAADSAATETAATGSAEAGDPGEVPEDEAPQDEPPQDEAADDDAPAALTSGPWRFFTDATESIAMYDFIFLDDGMFYESGARETSFGTYTVDGSTISLELTRVAELSAKNADGDERVETHSWNEWFTMQRTGNTLTGDRQTESWRFSYDDGMTRRGLNDVQPGITARPQRPDDPG